MNAIKPTIWSIQNEDEEANALFLGKQCVAIGWPKIGDLSQLPPERDAFRAKLIEHYLDTKPRLIPIYASQLFQFVYRIKQEDVVVYPATGDGKFHIGRVVGPYQYNPHVSENYPNLYPIEWRVSLPETDFSQAARREIRAVGMTVSQVRYQVKETLAAIQA